MKFIFILATLAFCHGGRAPYFGGELDDYVAESKRSYLPKPQHTAIKAVQVRAAIAQKRLNEQNAYMNALSIQQNAANSIAQNNVRSIIPEIPQEKPRRRSELAKIAGFMNPVPNALTENAVEKSGIPRPQVLSLEEELLRKDSITQKKVSKDPAAELNDNPRKSSDKKRSEIERLNYAARHRNVYLDRYTGGPDGRHRRSRMPYLGQNLDRLGVVRVRPNWESTEKKYLVPYMSDEVPWGGHHKRYRRSHMPYLGQNLDRLGVVRVRPNWQSGEKKTVLPNIQRPAPVAPNPPPALFRPYAPYPSPSVRGDYRSAVPKNFYNLRQPNNRPFQPPPPVRHNIPQLKRAPAAPHPRQNVPALNRKPFNRNPYQVPRARQNIPVRNRNPLNRNPYQVPRPRQNIPTLNRKPYNRNPFKAPVRQNVPAYNPRYPYNNRPAAKSVRAPQVKHNIPPPFNRAIFNRNFNAYLHKQYQAPQVKHNIPAFNQALYNRNRNEYLRKQYQAHQRTIAQQQKHRPVNNVRPYKRTQPQAPQPRRIVPPPAVNRNPYLRNPYQAQPPFPNPYFRGFITPDSNENNVETPVDESLPGIIRKKKSATGEENIAAMNYAARHRNVYLDSVSGDPNTGGSAVLTRQSVYHRHH